VSVFIDTSVWFAAVVARDNDNARAKSILGSIRNRLTTDHVLVETWLLLRSRFSIEAANRFWSDVRRSVRIETVTQGDLDRAWNIAFADQDFSIVDRTSFVVMERLGMSDVASFDAHFAVYRYGAKRDRAFNIVRSGHSATFRLLHRAILDQQQVVCTHRGKRREFCPYILGHKTEAERLLAFQFGGESMRRLPAGGEWRCFKVADLRDVELRDGPWRGSSGHTTKQRCVDTVYIDVNTDVPNQPGRQ
jgi:predicted nucleic acid-binding protein